MRILFLAYSPQNYFTSAGMDSITSGPWIDTLLEELGKLKNVSIAVALPIDSNDFKKAWKEETILYGLPNNEESGFFKKIIRRLYHKVDNNKLNTFIPQILDDFNPDLIQIFGSENPFGLIIPQLTKPVVIHIQGYLFVWKKKWSTGISRFEQFMFGNLNDLFLMRGSFNDFFVFRNRAGIEENVIRSCNYFMGRTDFDRRIALLLSPRSSYFHCEEFIRGEFFRNSWSLPLQNEVTCLSTLKGTTYKGIDLLVEVSIILKRYSAFNYKFRVCGVSEDEEIVKIIKKKYKKVTSFENIEFLGRLTTENLVTQLCKSNFYLHPSYIENSPNSVCEAMALGLPIVATKVGGIDSLIDDKVEGLLVQEGDPYSFAAAIAELTNNYQYAELLGMNARKKSLARHDPVALVSRLTGIYNEILSKSDIC